MTTAIQFRRGSSQEHLTFTGLQGEITVDTTKKTAVVHDEETISGFPLAREDLSNVSADALANKGVAKIDMSNVSCDDIANRSIAKQDLSNVSIDSFTQLGLLKADLSNVSVSATEETSGPIQIATSTEIEEEENVNKAVTPSQVGVIAKKYGKLPKKYINGFTLTRSSATSFAVGEGICRDITDTVDVKAKILSFVKYLNKKWSYGQNGGCLPATVELLPNSYYFVFVIANEDGSKYDYAVDKIANGTNIIDDPTIIEAGLDYIRIIGVITTDASSNIRPFTTKIISATTHQYEFITPIELLNSTEGNKQNEISVPLPALSPILIYATTHATAEQAYCKIKIKDLERNLEINSGGSAYSFSSLFIWIYNSRLRKVQINTDISAGTGEFTAILTSFQYTR